MLRHGTSGGGDSIVAKVNEGVLCGPNHSNSGGDGVGGVEKT